MSNWTDAIVGERMALDRDFSDRVRESEFSNQEWGLIMTATEFEIEAAADPDRARIVADTSNLPEMMPELENVRSQMSGGGGESSESVVDTIKSAFGLGGDDGDDERLETAERLVQEYAEELQERLESKGKWQRVRESYED